MAQLDQKTTLSLHEAAQLLVTEFVTLHDAEVILARAIEHARLHANVKRWATEQWDGKQLPGNIDRTGTTIERSDFDAWRKRASAA